MFFSLSCVFIVLSVQFDFVWLTHYSPVFLSVSTLLCPALPCLDSLKTVYLSYILVCMFLDPPSCVHRDNYFHFADKTFFQILMLININ